MRWLLWLDMIPDGFVGVALLVFAAAILNLSICGLIWLWERRP